MDVGSGFSRRAGMRAVAVLAAAAALLCVPGVASAARLRPVDAHDAITVKFAEGTDVRLRGGHLVTASGGRIAALDDVLARFPGVRAVRLFASATDAELAAAHREARDRTGRSRADLALYFGLRLPEGTDAAALVGALDALDVVEVAAAAAKPPPPPVTPSFAGGQGYRIAAAGGGVDADYAQGVPGGRGENVAIADIEYGWSRTHEDLSRARAADVGAADAAGCDSGYSPEHGTAVLGELSGDANSLGVTGLAPGASLRTIRAMRRDATGTCAWNLPDAINAAADATAPGDIILVEQQAYGPRSTDPASQVGLVPVEWDQTGAVRNAIRLATDRGRIVVEAGANGSQNLDDTIYGGWFSTDSGAMLVGAGNAPGCSWGIDPVIARGRLSFSNYGSAMDLQGWGDCVTTTGYGGLQGVSGGDDAYTSTFAGTSSAAPIVAASAAVLSSVAKSRGTTLAPAAVRSLLASTGQAQAFGNPGTIGPLPDLRAAIAGLGSPPPGPSLTESGHAITGTAVGATTVGVQETWATSAGTAARYEVSLSTDGGPFVKQALAAPASSTATFQLERNHTYRFATRAADAAGTWGDLAYGRTFRLGEYQENDPTGNPGFTGTWTRTASTAAVDGAVRLSRTAGDRASFAFTGGGVAWIATKASNRGKARVYVDGVLSKTVDLYAASTAARAIAFTASWTPGAAHRIEVQVVGTAGRPAVDVDAFVSLQDFG